MKFTSNAVKDTNADDISAVVTVATSENKGSRRRRFRVLLVLPVATFLVGGFFLVKIHSGLLNGTQVTSIKDLDSLMYHLIPSNDENEQKANNDKKNIRKLIQNKTTARHQPTSSTRRRQKESKVSSKLKFQQNDRNDSSTTVDSNFGSNVDTERQTVPQHDGPKVHNGTMTLKNSSLPTKTTVIQKERKASATTTDSKTESSSNTERQTVPQNDEPKTDHETKKKKPLNIVLLYADDMRHDSIGIAGTQIVQTPNIDKMARQGIRFTHNCVTTSVCWISRATLYTGQYQSRHGNTMPFEKDWQKNWTKSWPYLLQNEAGYYQGHVGKWHHKAPKDIRTTFDVWKSYYGKHILPSTGQHITKQNELDAIEFLQNRPKDNPFLLSVCYFAPHAWDGNDAVWVPQNSSMKLYKDEDGNPVPVPVPVSFTDDAWSKMPYFFDDRRNEARVRFRQRFDEPDKFQHMMRNYYRLISEIDSSVGVVVKELERQGVLDETLVIFTTDNGFFHAEHAMAGKWYPHEESVRVPLVIRDPRIPKDKIGTTNDEFTLNIDLAETILGAAGLDAPDTMQGRDIADLYVENPKDSSEWRKEFFYEHPMHRHNKTIPASNALVRKDFKYMLWPEFGLEQLFDLKNDPYELNDIFNTTEHADLIEEMRSRFKELAVLAK